mmetsp:Transcript_32012/g.89625  ORF Transcript_32012/g.89625 Transcript_32012/m.89625 type:complete len:406 (+) Transcript_32012:66-1283(+)
MKYRDGKDRRYGSNTEKVSIIAKGVTYTTHKVTGQGSFGVVFQATVDGGKEVVAIKKVLQDKRFKNRELQIMRLLSHPNVVQLKNSFFTNGETLDEVFLNLVLEYVPDTVHRVSRQYSKMKQPISLIYVKLYMYQLLRALAYIHSLGVCHRDIKPQNLLLDPQTSILKLCDFGSAKILVKGNPNVSYICSRYYRAPELIFGATLYTTAIDVWSSGCVMAELLLGHPLFPGESGVDQLVEIIKVLGTPSKEQIQCMNQNYTDFKFPKIKPHPWHKIFRPRTSPDAIDLIVKMLQYDPVARIDPLKACAHPFFDKLRDPNVRLPNGRAIPPLFNFTEKELECMRGFQDDIIPLHLQGSDFLGGAQSASDSRPSEDDTEGESSEGNKEGGKPDGQAAPPHLDPANITI